MTTIATIAHRVNLLRQQNADRDQRMSDVLLVRTGQADKVLPDLFPESWPKPIVANFIDVVARDLAELIAPLPALNCSSANMVSDNAKKFADKRTKISHYYAKHSKLQVQMYTGADRYLTYGFLPILVEPDFEAKCPRIKVEDPSGAYVERDRFGRVTGYAKVYRKPANVLAAEFPEFARQLLPDTFYNAQESNALLEVVRWYDESNIVVFVPQRNNLVLVQTENLLGKVPVVVAQRPGLDDVPHGQFDDVLWVQLAKARMALYGMDAAEKSINAPLVVPNDVQEFPVGPDAVIRTNNPQGVGRVGVEMSPAAIQEESVLEREMRVGARYPEGRSGNVDASIITGRGIQELLGGFDTQVKGAQAILQDAFRQVFELCFEMDEKLWGNTEKTIRGEVHGAPFQVTYRPSKDIKGDYTIDVQYGLAAGMDPNRWLVFMLQLRGDRLVPREFVQRQMPFDVNVTQLQQMIDVEETRDALKQAYFGLAQALPALVQTGADPTVLVRNMAAVVDRLQKGDAIEEAVLAAMQEATKPEEPEPAPEAEQELGMGEEVPGEPGMPGEQAEGINPFGLPTNVAPGQQGLGPGGRPDLQMLLAGLTEGGQPTLRAHVSRRLPA